MATTKKLKVKANDDNLLRATENHGSDEPLVLDPDAKASSLKSIKDIHHALAFLHEMISKDTCTVSTRHNTMGVSRSEFRQLGKFLGAEADTQQEDELRLQLLRQANTEVHRLREEMGKGVTVDAIGSKLYQMDRTIYNWWKNLGFTYSKATMGAHSRGGNFHVEFSISVDRHISSMSEKPVSDKARLEKKHEALGAELQIAKDGSEMYVLDNPNNRAWVVAKLRERFPKCNIWKWESISIHRSDDFQLRHVEVYIDFADVGNYEEDKEYPGQ